MDADDKALRDIAHGDRVDTKMLLSLVGEGMVFFALTDSGYEQVERLLADGLVAPHITRQGWGWLRVMGEPMAVGDAEAEGEVPMR